MLSAEEILYKVAKLLNEDTQVSREEVVEKTDDVYEDIVSQGLNKKSSNSRQEEADDELDDEDGLEDKEDEDEERGAGGGGGFEEEEIVALVRREFVFRWE